MLTIVPPALLLTVALLLTAQDGAPPTPDAVETVEPIEDGAAQDTEEPESPPGFLSPSEWDPTTPRGVLVNDPRASEGLTFVSPINSTKGYLLELDGTIAHEWQFDSAPGEWAYLQNDGSLWRSARQDEDQHFRGGGIGGRLQRVAPDGTLLCDYDLSSLGLCNHHDIEVLPNGHVLVIAWERIARETAIANGRDPEHVGGAGLWPDTILELRPYGGSEFEIVWQWRAWDHLVQDFDQLKANFGDVTNPHRIDVNGDHRDAAPVSRVEAKRLDDLAAQLEALGYAQGIGTATAGSGEDETDEERERRREWLDRSGDFMHTNGITYHPAQDLIAISTPEFNEIWVIDHSTSIEEARGSSGGRWGHGGDLLYRWGNPKTYGHGTADDQHLGYQHDPRWLETADGSLRMTLFNNNGGEETLGEGDDETTRNWSIVEELVLPFDPERGFVREEGQAFGPTAPVWSYADPDHFYSAFISGAERLPNGNTLICSGAGGRAFEVTPDGETVWNYRCDLGGDVTPPDHAGNAPKDSLFRASRYSRTHPGIEAILRAKSE